MLLDLVWRCESVIHLVSQMGRKSQKGRRRQNSQPSRLGDLGGPTGLALEVTLKAGARFYESVSYLGQLLFWRGGR